MSSVTRNCQIYSMQFDTLNTGFFKLKEFLNFIIVRRNNLLNNKCRFVSPNFRFKDTGIVNFITDPELSSSLYMYHQKHNQSIRKHVNIRSIFFIIPFWFNLIYDFLIDVIQSTRPKISDTYIRINLLCDLHKLDHISVHVRFLVGLWAGQILQIKSFKLQHCTQNKMLCSWNEKQDN